MATTFGLPKQAKRSLALNDNAKIQTNDKITQAIAASKDRHYFFLLTKNEPAINWAKFATELYLVSDSVNTVTNYCKAICKFRDMVQVDNKTVAQAIDEIKAQTNGLVYQYFADFVTYCHVTKSYSPSTTRGFVAAVKRLFIFSDIDIDNNKLRYKVKLPKKTRLKDPYPSNEQIKAILNAASIPVRTFLQVMLDTGLEPTDLTQLKPKNIDFSSVPASLTLDREKTGEAIETFVSKDTADAVKQLIAQLGKGNDDYIFTKSFDALAIQRIRNNYNLAVARAGFGRLIKLKSGGYQGRPDKIEGHTFGKFHLKVYKKRWFTLVAQAGVPTYVAQGMLGRKAYLDEYFNLTPDKKAEFARKILKIVSIYSEKIDKQEVIDQVAKSLNVDPKLLNENTLRELGRALANFAKLPSTDKARLFGEAKG